MVRRLFRATADDPYGYRDKSEIDLEITAATLAEKDLKRAAAAKAELTRRRQQVARSATRAARWAAIAGIASAICAVTLAAGALLAGDNKTTIFARCELAKRTAASPEQYPISVCMRASGYRDTCGGGGGSPPGMILECFAPESFILWLRDAIR
jgi:hypothetical protein